MDNLIKLSASYYNTALKHIKCNEVSKAIELIEKSLKYYSKDIDVLNLMGVCQYMICDFKKAHFYWTQSLNCEKNNRAECYLNFLNSDEFKKFIKKYNLAINYAHNSKYKEAIKLLEEIINFDNDLIEPYVIISLCYYGVEEFRLSNQYIKLANEKDKSNLTNLTYLNKINNKDMLKNKNKILKNNYIPIVSMMLIFIVIGLYYNKHKEYNQISQKTSEYENKINKINMSLEESKAKYSELKNKLDNEKNEGLLSNQFIESFSQVNENSIFNNAILEFKNKEYENAVKKFEYIVNRGIEENLVAESIYYSGVCFEKVANYELAEKYYNSYINKFIKENYYDDSLYNYGLMLYKQGNKEKAKIILRKLEQEVSSSIFVNSKVKYILSN